MECDRKGDIHKTPLTLPILAGDNIGQPTVGFVGLFRTW